MRIEYRLAQVTRSAVLALLLAAVSNFAFADAVSTPPPPHGTLTPIADADLSPLPVETQAAIAAARERLAKLLVEEGALPEALAAAYGELGALYQVNDLLTSAEAAFENAAALEPTELRWTYYAGYLALETGRAELALEHLERAREFDVDYPPLTLRRAQALLELSRLEAARPLFKSALESPGLAAAAHYGLGQIAMLQRRHGAAVEHFDAALSLDTNASALHYPLAQALRASGQDERAREQLNQRGRDLPQVDDPLLAELQAHGSPSLAEFRNGMLARRAGQWTEAAEAFGAGLELEPGNSNARISYARALYLSGDREAARKQLERVRAEEADDILARFLIAILDEAAGENERAIQAYREIIAVDGGHAGARFYLGLAAMRSEDFGQAAKHLDAAVAADPSNIPAYLYRDVSLERSGASDAERIQGLEAALRRSPEDPLIRYRLARILAIGTPDELRDSERALEMAQLLAATQPMPQHIELLALAQASGGNFDAGADLLEPLLAMAAFGPPGEFSRLEQVLADYRTAKLPDIGPDPSSAYLARPAPVDPTGPIRDYPAVEPF